MVGTGAELGEDNSPSDAEVVEGDPELIIELREGVGAVSVASTSGEGVRDPNQLLTILNTMFAEKETGLTARPMTEDDIDEWVETELKEWQDTLDPRFTEEEHRRDLEARLRSRIAIVPETTIVVVDGEDNVVLDTVSFLTNVSPEATRSWHESTGRGMLVRQNEVDGRDEVLHNPDGEYRYIMSFSGREHPDRLVAVDVIIAAYKHEVAVDPTIKAAAFVARISGLLEWYTEFDQEKEHGRIDSASYSILKAIVDAHSFDSLLEPENEALLQHVVGVYLTPIRERSGGRLAYRDPLVSKFAAAGAKVVKGVTSAMEYDIASGHSGAVFVFRAEE